MEDLAPGSIVILHCAAPKEKMWGLLLRLDAVGALVRGMDLDSVEDWLRQEVGGIDRTLGPSTFLVPSHRIVRIDLDESGPVVPGYADRYHAATGRAVKDALVRPTHLDAHLGDRDGEVQ